MGTALRGAEEEDRRENKVTLSCREHRCFDVHLGSECLVLFFVATATSKTAN